MKKYPVEFLRTPAGELQSLRDFAPEPMPEFDGASDTFEYTKWHLYDRVCDGIKSFLILLDKQQIYDAFIIAGHVMETCAMLSYIKDGKTKEERINNFYKYTARAYAGIMLEILRTSESLEKDSAWNAYTGFLQFFYPVGVNIIKDTKNPKQKHEEIIKKINNRLGTNVEKIKLIEKNYERPNIEEYLRTFSENIDSVDEQRFKHFYLKYCDFKHTNVLACLEWQIPDYQIERVITVLVIIVTYLSMAKLEPYVHLAGI